MRTCFIALIGLVMQIAMLAQPPALLQIVREPLKLGSETAFNAIEEDRARISASLGCPHPYLGAESLTGSKEMAALQKSAKLKASLTLEPIEVFASYRPDLSGGTPWLLGHGRYLVITATKSNRRLAGTVFEGPDGTRFTITSAQTRQEAEHGSRATPPFWQPNSPAKRD
jgi:hypothetical protein